MKRTHSRIVAASGNIVQAVFNTVAELFTQRMKDTRKAGTSVTDAIAGVTSGTVRGASQVGADLGHTGKGLMLAVFRGTKEAGAEGISAISHTAEAAIQATASVGGDLERTATGLIQGAVQCAQEVGVAAEVAVSAVADGALKAAGKLSSTAVETVRAAINKESGQPEEASLALAK